MPDKKDYAALMNAAEAKAASAAAPVKDYAAMMNQAEAGQPVTDAVVPVDPVAPAAVDPETNEVLSWQSGEGNAPHTMQSQVGLTKEQVRQVMSDSGAVFTSMMRNAAPEPAADGSTTPSSPSVLQKVTTQGVDAMRNAYKQEVQSSLDFIRKDYAAHAKELEGYWVNSGEKTAIPTQIGRAVAMPDPSGGPTVANAAAVNDAYENRLVDPTRDPRALKQYIDARKSLLRQERNAEISNLPPVQQARGNGTDLFGIANSPELNAVNAKYDKLESDFTNATAGLAYLKVVNSFMQEKKTLNARQLGIEVQKVLGDSAELERQERLSRKGIEQPSINNVNNEIVGYRAMQYAAREAASDGRDGVAKQLYDRSENYMDKVRANNPKFVKEQRIAAIQQGIAQENSNVLRNTLIGYYPTQEDINSYAAANNIDPTGITPDDIGGISPAANRVLGSFIKNSAGGLYTSAVRFAASDAAISRYVDWDKFNEHYNENWYDNTFLGPVTHGKLTNSASQLFEGGVRVNTGPDKDYLMNVKNPGAGSFTWDASAIVNQMADGLGQIAAFGTVSSRLGEGAQAASLVGRAVEGTAAAEAAVLKADRIGTALNVGLTQYNNSYNEALQAIGDGEGDEGAREAYALFRMISSAGTEMILPDSKIVRDVFGPGTAAGRQLIDMVSKGGFRTLEHSAVKNLYVQAIKGGVTDWAKETSEDVLDQAGTFVADQLLAPKKAANTDYLGELKQTIVTSAISSFLPTATSGARRQMANPAMNMNLMYQVGSNPDQYINELNSQVDDGTLSRTEADGKIKVVNTMSDIVANGVPKAADGTDLPRGVQVAYANNLLQSTLLEAQKQGVKDAALQESIDNQLGLLRTKRMAMITQSVLQASASQQAEPPAVLLEAPATSPTPPSGAPSGGIQEATPLRQSEPAVAPLEPTVFVDEQPSVGALVDSGRPVIVDGQRAELSLDGQRVIATIIGSNREYEVGNIDQLRDTQVNAVEGFDMEAERPEVSITNQGRYHIRGQFYANNYSDPTSAINYDGDGNVVSVNLDTEDGKKRTFRGQTAEDIAYQIQLQQLASRNEQREFQDFLERDDEATQQLDRYAGSFQQAPESGTAQATTQVPGAESAIVQQPVPITRPTTDPNNPFQSASNATNVAPPTTELGQPETTGDGTPSGVSQLSSSAQDQPTQPVDARPAQQPVGPNVSNDTPVIPPTAPSGNVVDQRFGFAEEAEASQASADPVVGVQLPPIPEDINLLADPATATQSNLPSVSIDNFDRLLQDYAARLSISSNGQQIGFEEFDVTIDRSDNTAQVNFVRKTNRAENKGIGLAAYIELGKRLAERGITLESKNQAQLPGGRSVWNSLIALGLAERVGSGQYVFKASAASSPAVTPSSGSVGGQITERYTNAPKVDGRTFTRTLPDGTQMAGRYILTTSDAATPSHNPNTFSTSEGFPTTTAGRNPNDRNYSLPENSQRVVARAANYDGRAVDNAPTVDANGVVIDGNDRVMSGQIAEQQGTDAAYIAALRANAEAYGFTAQQVDDMIAAGQHPRLLFQVDQAQPYTTETFARFNPSESGKAKSAQEQAVQLGRTLPASAARIIGDAIAPFATMSDFYNTPNASRAVRDAMVQAGVLTTDSLPRYFNAQRAAFTEEGKQLFQNLMLGQVFDEDTIGILANNPALQQKMLLAVKNLLAIEQNPDFSLRGLIGEAVQLKAKVDAYAAEAGITDKKKALEQYLRAGNLFDAMPSFPAIAMYVEIEQPSQKSVVNFTKQWMDQIANYQPGMTEDLFGERQPTRAALIAQLTTKVGQYEQYANRSAEQQVSPAPAAQPQQPDAGGPAADVRATEPAAEPAAQERQPEGGQFDAVTSVLDRDIESVSIPEIITEISDVRKRIADRLYSIANNPIGISTWLQRLWDGEISSSNYQRRFEDIRRSVARRASKDGVEEGRGAIAALDEIEAGVRDLGLSKSAAVLAGKLIETNPDLFSGLAVVVQGRGIGSANAQGFYSPRTQTLTVYTDTQAHTLAHELLHHTERFLPEDIKNSIRDEWRRAVNNRIAFLEAEASKPNSKYRSTDDLPFLKLAAQLESGDIEKDREVFRRVAAAVQGFWNVDLAAHYQYSHPSEWWTMNATPIFERDNAAISKNVIGRLRQWYNEFITAIRSIGSKKATEVADALSRIVSGRSMQESSARSLTTIADQMSSARVQDPAGRMAQLVDLLARKVALELAKTNGVLPQDIQALYDEGSSPDLNKAVDIEIVKYRRLPELEDSAESKPTSADIVPVAAPSPAAPVTVAINGKPNPTGDPRQDAINEFAWRQSVLDAKELRMERVPQQIKDEEDALRLAEGAIARADEGSKTHDDNKKVADVARANLKKMRDDLTSTRVTLESARKNVEDARSKMERMMSKSADNAEATSDRAAAREAAAQEAGVVNDGSAQSEYEIAKAQNDVAEANVNRLVARLEEIKGSEQTPEWASEVARIKDGLLAARKAKRTAGQRMRRANANGAGDAIRRGKSSATDLITANVAGISPQTYNAALELIAKAVEGGVSLTNAIQQGVDYINDRWFTKWNETALRNLLGQNQLIALTPDEMRAHVESRVPLSQKNETAARNMLDEIRNDRMSHAEALQYINGLPLSAGVKASIRQYVSEYYKKDILAAAAQTMARDFYQQNGNDYDVAITALNNAQIQAFAAAQTPAALSNIRERYAAGLTTLETQRNVAGIQAGTIQSATTPSPSTRKFSLPERDWRSKIKEAVQNRYRRAEQAIERSLVPVTRENDFATAMQLAKSKAAYAIDGIESIVGYINPKKGTMFYRMAKDKIDFGKFSEWLYARHAPERNEQNAKDRQSKHDAYKLELNLELADPTTTPARAQAIIAEKALLDSNAPESPFPLMPDGGSGMTTAEANKIIADAAADGREAKYLQYEKEFRANVVDRILEVKYENGIIDEKTYNKLKSHYKFYVPLKLNDEQEAEAEGRNYTNTSVVVGKDVYRSSGSVDKGMDARNNVIGQAIVDLENSFKQAEDNRSMRIMGNFINENPDPTTWNVVPARYQENRNSETGEVVDIQPLKQPDNVVSSYYVDGKLNYITSTDPGIQNMFKKVSQPELVQKLSNVSRYMTVMYAQMSPSFIIRNVFSDQQDAYLSLLGQNDKNFVKHFRKHLFKGQVQILRALAGKQNEWTPIIEDFKKNGGEISFITHLSNENEADKAMKLYQSLQGANPVGLANRRRAWEAVKEFTGSLEQLTRIQAYRAAVEAGVDKLMEGGLDRATAEAKVDREKAALVSRNATVDFDKKGYMSPYLSIAKAFFNPGVQGLTNTIWSVKTSKRARYFTGAMLALGFLSAELGRQFGDCDDPGSADDCWDEIPEYVKARSLMLPTFLITGKGTGYTAVPFGRAFTFVPYLGASISSLAHGKMDRGKFVSNIMSTMFANYNPVGGDAPLSQQAVGNLAPAMALYTNQSPIGDRGIRPGNEAKLKSQDYYPKTGDAYVNIAGVLHRATGGEDGKAGLVEISPNHLEFMMQTVGGGVYNFFHQSATAVNHAQDPSKEVQEKDVPLWNIFRRESDMAGTQTTYFDLADKSKNQILSQEEQAKMSAALNRLVAGGIITEEQKGKRFNFVERNQTGVIRAIDNKNEGGVAAPAGDPGSVNTEGSVGTEGSASTEGSISSEGSTSTEGSSE